MSDWTPERLMACASQNLDANQLCYVLWCASGERLPVQAAAEVLEAHLQRAYQRGRRTEARKCQRRRKP